MLDYAFFADALLGGQVQVMVVPPTAVVGHIKSGRLRALAVTSLQRAAAAPELPTIAESGYKDFEMAAWYGLMVPIGTSREIIGKLNSTTRMVLALPDVRERLVQEGSEPMPNAPAQFGTYIKAEITKWTAVVKAANLRAD